MLLYEELKKKKNKNPHHILFYEFSPKSSFIYVQNRLTIKLFKWSIIWKIYLVSLFCTNIIALNFWGLQSWGLLFFVLPIVYIILSLYKINYAVDNSAIAYLFLFLNYYPHLIMFTKMLFIQSSPNLCSLKRFSFKVQKDGVMILCSEVISFGSEPKWFPSSRPGSPLS